ncbi:GNAT family N-acetyltransferase [Paenibacillus medicaginis]|uniref:GNAT family N-acetyltransferase n=1 Tax=Paenibacillus medicaginis TaxID=1470560 RepID=A0ABV5BVY6_9BACL
MEHTKLYRVHDMAAHQGNLTVEGPVDESCLRDLLMHEQLDAFRVPREQHHALIDIASLPEGRVIIARDERVIIGYVTFHYPDECERWSEGGMKDLLELGAIEVADNYRSAGLGRQMLRAAFEDGQLDDYIVFTTEYYWHWDLKNTQMSVWDYRKMMEKLMKTVDMVWFATDDPEICAHPANCLMVRIGNRVPLSSAEQFDRVRFRNRFMY